MKPLQKKAVLIALSLLLAFSAGQMALTAFSIFDAFASSGSVSLSINVIPDDATAPSIEIGKPENRTYRYSYIELDAGFTEQETAVSSAYYSINDGQNTTLALDSNNRSRNYISLGSAGSKKLSVFANNTAGKLGSATVFLTYNPTSYQFKYENYSSHSNTTNLSQYGSEELDFLDSFKLYKSGKGGISWLDAINLTDYDSDSPIIDFDQHTLISDNYIFVNSTAFRGLNKSATLTISGLTFVDPVIQMDGITCPSTICVKNSYVGGVLSFNVTHFTAYSAAESSSSSGTSGAVSGSGSSGGIGAETQAAQNIDGTRIDVVLIGEPGEDAGAQTGEGDTATVPESVVGYGLSALHLVLIILVILIAFAIFIKRQSPKKKSRKH